MLGYQPRRESLTTAILAGWFSFCAAGRRMNVSNTLLDERGDQVHQHLAAPDRTATIRSYDMAVQIIPTTIFTLADELADESGTLRVGLDMMFNSLMIQPSDEEQARRAIDQLYFIGRSLSGLQKRLDVLAAAAYDISNMEKAAA